MKKPLLFIGTALCVALMASCDPDEIEQNNPTQKVDIEKRARDTGDTGHGTDIPSER